MLPFGLPIDMDHCEPHGSYSAFSFLNFAKKKNPDWLYFMHTIVIVTTTPKKNCHKWAKLHWSAFLTMHLILLTPWPCMVFEFSFVSFMHSCCHSLWHSFMHFYFAQLQLQKTQYLQLGQNRAQCYGGSLPNVNQIGNSNTDLPFQVSY